MRGPEAFSFDCHVHIGQYCLMYYQPSWVVRALCRNGVRRAWVSSTTACIAPDSAEQAQYLSRHIDEEVEEALAEAKRLKMSLVPLYWAVPNRYCALDKVGALYAGFKIHPKVGEWAGEDGKQLLRDVCDRASRNDFPVLIHTGVDEVDSPARFETYFAHHPSATFVLAHCRDADEIIRLFGAYDNLFGDVAFCPAENYNAICRAGFSERMLWGTDFPVTHWTERKNDEISADILAENYKATLERFKSAIRD